MVFQSLSLFAAGTLQTGATAGVNGAGQNAADYNELTVQVSVTAITGTNPSFQVLIDASCDNGTTWTQVAAGTAIVATGNQIFSVGIGSANNIGLGNMFRARYTFAGTASPTVTFGIKAVVKG